MSVQYQARFSLPPFKKKIDKSEQTQTKVGMMRDLENMVYGLCSLGSRKIVWICESQASVMLENSKKECDKIFFAPTGG